MRMREESGHHGLILILTLKTQSESERRERQIAQSENESLERASRTHYLSVSRSVLRSIKKTQPCIATFEFMVIIAAS